MKELIEIQAELKASKGQAGFANRYKYRNCDDIMEALKPFLKPQKCYVTLSDKIIEVGGRIYVESTAKIRNEAGEHEEVTASARENEHKAGMDDAQCTGTASSYARKTALGGLFLIDDSDDLDGEDHSKQHQPAKQQPKPNNDKDLIKRINDGMTALNKAKIEIPSEILAVIKDLSKKKSPELISIHLKLLELYKKGKK